MIKFNDNCDWIYVLVMLLVYWGLVNIKLIEFLYFWIYLFLILWIVDIMVFGFLR